MRTRDAFGSKRARRPVAASLLCWTLLLLSGCSVGPRYSRPAIPAPPEYKELPPNWKTAQPSDQIAKGKWWEVFQDPQLNTLEEQINISNQTLKAAQAQFEQARAIVRINRANLYPSVAAGVNATRNHQSSHRPNGRLAPTNAYTDLQLPVDASYEADVWGRVRRTVEAARANAQASAADLESVSLSLHAELAADYFQLRTLDAEAQLLNSTVAAYEKALELTENRYSGGVASQVDVAQAQTQLETTRAQAIELGVQRAQFEHAIAVLSGQPASTLAVTPSPLASTPPLVPAGVPSDLLERRPDVAGNERRMAVANAQIGVAKAAYYPTITLSASGGFEGSSITNWFNGPSGFILGGASALVTALDAGRRRAVTDEARAAYDQSVAIYRETVLGAFQEVEDSLAALRLLEEEARTQDAAVAAAGHSLTLSTNRYKGGVATYLEVITAQSIALTDQRTAVEIGGRRMVASVSLIRALGGGWNAANLPMARNENRPQSATGQSGLSSD
ncbi:MAG TPA: efflux transporter outer membrane subunit [Terriglobales bacterium]|nr:efflux transporter outer membrane subunit [Terriglobales bacterium]